MVYQGLWSRPGFFRFVRRDISGWIIAVPLAVIFASGCGKTASDPSAKSSDTRGDSSAANRTAPTPTKGDGAFPTGSVGAIEKLPFDKGTVPGACSYTGKILDGARWRDANGENILVVSERTTKAEEGSVQEIFGYCWVLEGDGARLLWKIQDKAENWCDAGKGLLSDILVHDVDGDGIAENAFIYNIEGSCDVSPSTHKLLMHSGATKLAIRGNNLIKMDGKLYGGEKKFDPAFTSSSEQYRKWASDLWDKTVK